MAEKILAFDDWKTKYYPAWYLNSQEKDEELFEEWLEYKRAAEAISENEQAQSLPFFVSGKLRKQCSLQERNTQWHFATISIELL